MVIIIAAMPWDLAPWPKGDRSSRCASRAQAFTRAVQQEPDNGDAWANIAAVHLQRRSWGPGFSAAAEARRRAARLDSTHGVPRSLFEFSVGSVDDTPVRG